MKRAVRHTVVAGVTLAVFLIAAGAALAETATTLCIPERAGKPVVSGTSEGKCTKAKYSPVVLPSGGALATLDKVLPHIAYVEKGVAGNPTIQFSGVNVQVVNGEGKTASVNGEGNLVVGYDEDPGTQTGSHNLILGQQQTFESYGGIVAGWANLIGAPFASVTGGQENRATGYTSWVSGGRENDAAYEFASVLGGRGNVASGYASLVTGGIHNRAETESALASGGQLNVASGAEATVTGGERNLASGNYASTSGGYLNTASGKYASTSGGESNRSESEATSVAGGADNRADGAFASVSGGGENTARNERSSVSGGQHNEAAGRKSSVSGGEENDASGEWASVSGGNNNTASGQSASISGGSKNTAREPVTSITGGENNTADGAFAWIGGGSGNRAEARSSSILGGKGLREAGEYEALALAGAILHESSRVTLNGEESDRGGDATVSCPVGETAVGGGGKLSGSNLDFENSEPTTNDANTGTPGQAATGWRVEAYNHTFTEGTFAAYVLCVP